MGGLVDHEAVLVEFEAWLVEDGRVSHGTDYLTRKLAELRARHRIDQTAERALLRHFSSDLTDVFFGLVPVPATSDPLAVGDRETPAAMDDGAINPSPLREDACPKDPPPPPPIRSPREPVSHLVAPPRRSPTQRAAAAATS